jgi:RHH-type rel operon transcriptional repressor/antitoxin RelB
MLSIDLDPEIEQRLKQLAKRTGKTEAELARELVEHNLEDLEDICIAETRLANPARTFSVEEVRKELGLDELGLTNALSKISKG